MFERKKYLIPEEWLSKPRIVCGLMSGTSLDGVDAALCKFWIEKRKHKFKLLGFSYLPFDDTFKKKIFQIINQKVLIKDIAEVNFQLSHYYANAINILLTQEKIKCNLIDLIGMHGQTVWHQPPNINKTLNSNLPTTLQLASAPALCQNLGIPVVSDFRSADIALGGQGAPLVPLFDKEFLSDNKRNVIALNIGGIANITYLPLRGDIIAFDTGPGNVLIDEFSRIFFKIEFDKNGEFASKGNLSNKLFTFLKKIKFVDQHPPKSTGRELFNKELIEEILKIADIHFVSKFDVVHTLTYFTAWSIAENIRLFANDTAKIIVSGGGSSNSTLMNILKSELPKAEIIKSDDLVINSDAKEAICFAYLAWRNLANLPGNIISVTGADREAILGNLTVP